MTPDDGMDRSVKPRAADRLNAFLDQLTHGHRDDGHGLDPSLVATVGAVMSLGKHGSAHTSDPDSVDRSWRALISTVPSADPPRWRDRGDKVGLVASPVGVPSARPRSWPVGLLSAVAAILLATIVASHYSGLPGRPSTSTVLASGAPTVTPSGPVVPADCGGGVATSSMTTRTGDSPTAVVPTRTVMTTVTTCGTFAALDHP